MVLTRKKLSAKQKFQFNFVVSRGVSPSKVLKELNKSPSFDKLKKLIKKKK